MDLNIMVMYMLHQVTGTCVWLYICLGYTLRWRSKCFTLLRVTGPTWSHVRSVEWCYTQSTFWPLPNMILVGQRDITYSIRCTCTFAWCMLLHIAAKIELTSVNVNTRIMPTCTGIHNLHWEVISIVVLFWMSNPHTQEEGVCSHIH